MMNNGMYVAKSYDKIVWGNNTVKAWLILKWISLSNLSKGDTKTNKSGKTLTGHKVSEKEMSLVLFWVGV